MTRRGKGKNLQESAEIGNDADKMLTMEMKKTIFQEML